MQSADQPQQQAAVSLEEPTNTSKGAKSARPEAEPETRASADPAGVVGALSPLRQQEQQITRRARLLPNVILAGLLGAILLVLALWLGGLRLGFLPATPNQPQLLLSAPGLYLLGSSVTLRGEQFAPFGLVALLRDGQPATDTQGLRLAVMSDKNGAFTVTLPITPDWHAGEHIIGAEDTTTHQRAAILIQVENTSGTP